MDQPHVVSRPACHVTLCHVRPVTSRASLPSTNTHTQARPVARRRSTRAITPGCLCRVDGDLICKVHSPQHACTHVRTDVHTDVYIYTHTHVHTRTHTRADWCTADIYWCCGCICQPVFPTHLLNFHLTDRQTVRQTGRRTDRLCRRLY